LPGPFGRNSTISLMSPETSSSPDDLQDVAFIYGIFKAELMGYCGQTKIAHKGLLEGLEQRRAAHAWFAAQAILNTSANASKLLWGSRSEGPPVVKDARLRLRSESGVSDRSPLRGRDLRNDFEHIDERIVKWVAGGGRMFGSRSIDWGDEDDFAPPGTAKFGVIVASLRTVEFFDQEAVALDEIAEEFARIQEKLHPF
jgi:hypothetical protein